MNEQEYNGYMQSLAQALKAIGDDPASEMRRFATIEEVWDAQRANIDYASLIMVVMWEQTAVSNLGNANLVEWHSAGFWLVRKCEAGNFEEIRQAYDDAQSAGKSIFSKMVKDKSEGHSLMKYLDLSKMEYKKAGPIFGGLCHGMEFTFRLAVKAGCGYKYDADKWNF